jgi:hypothetical protein
MTRRSEVGEPWRTFRDGMAKRRVVEGGNDKEEMARRGRRPQK